MIVSRRQISVVLWSAVSVAGALALSSCHTEQSATPLTPPWARVIAATLPANDQTSYPVAWEKESHDNPELRSILRLRNEVFATSDDGFYHADLKDCRWKRITGMPMKAGGSFASEPLDSTTLFYVTDGTNHPNVASMQLWRSFDLGKSWQRVNDGRRLWSVLLTRGSQLYASDSGALIYSSDLGEHWANIPTEGVVSSLSASSARPDSVAIPNRDAFGACWYGLDGTHAVPVRIWDSPKGGPAIESFMDRGGFSSRGFMCTATLQSYFPDQYRNDVRSVTLTANAAKENYEFAEGAAMPVRFTVRTVASAIPKKLVDFDDAAGCWSIALLTIDTNAWSRKQLPKKLGRLRQVHTVDRTHSFDRTMDLSELEGGPITPGRYRAKFAYDSEDFADETAGEWLGGFQGADFGIDIGATAKK